MLPVQGHGRAAPPAPQLRAIAHGVVDAHHGGEQLVAADVAGPLTGGQGAQPDIAAAVPGVAPAAPGRLGPDYPLRLQVVGGVVDAVEKSGVADEVGLFRRPDLLQAPAPAGDQCQAFDVSELDTFTSVI